MKLAADANVLLSAVLGGRAKLILQHPTVQEVFTTALTLSEVEQYAEVLAAKRRLPADLALLSLATLPVTVVERPEYAKSLPRAAKQIARRDPEDVDLVALAIHLRIPVWSNDRHFEGISVETFTTEDLLRRLRII